MNNKKILSFAIFLFILFLGNICFAKDLDVINDYSITVDPRLDGSLDLEYHIEWEVLDSTSEGPLSWVKIGIPNSKVDSIRASSDNIQNIKYYNESGDYIRINFTKDYYEGDIISFDFKIHQSYMYTISSNKCTYSFTPGWFNDIEVKNINIYWNSDKVLSSSTKEKNSDGYLVWSGKLKKGKKLEAKVVYDLDAFNIDRNKQFSDSKSSNSSNFKESATNVGIIIFIFVVIAILSVFTGTGYNSHGGYGYDDYGYRRHHHYHHHSTTHSSCASSCACVSSCACACACAGGGRAGCSKKDFYGTNLTTKNIQKALNK